MITVAACIACNKSFSADDDYFWLTLASRVEATENAAAAEASLRAVEHISRPEAAGFRTAFLETVKSVEVKSPSGLHLGNTLAYDVSFPRVNRVAARITRGLFCFERRTTLAPGYIAAARAIEGFTPEAHPTLQPLIAFANGADVRKVGTVFSYRFRSVLDDPHSSVVMFYIYETTAFLGLTVKADSDVWTEWI